jgi:Putative peptidase family
VASGEAHFSGVVPAVLRVMSARLRTLQPIIFVPQDQAAAFRPAFVDALWQALGEVMRWYRRHTDREVFQSRAVVEYVGKRPAHEYFQDTQALVQYELQRLWNVGSDGITYVCYGLWGEGPYQAQGNVIGASGDYLVVQSSTSLVMFVEDGFPGYDRSLTWNNRRAQTGALAHELGHTLGLPHTADVEPGRAQESIMHAWWDYPRAGFTERELAMVLAAIA